jgi:hypothetical protein
VSEAGQELAIVFRDHALSDQIGFRYQHADAIHAVNDFMGCLNGILQSVPTGEPALVSVILDGENCWEHYPGGGVAFLRELYHRCTTTQGVKSVTIGEFLKHHPPRTSLPKLFAGSWISHNFAIWIGHEEDNTARDALHRTREYLIRRQRDGVSGQPLLDAWREMHIAEGSDWFWWFGDDHSSAQDALFDYLFRKHLQNVYLLLGEEPPAELDRPISRHGHRVQYTKPRALLEVTVDGRYSFFEWVSAGHYCCQNERGTMAMAMKGPLQGLYFGFDLERLLLRIDCEEDAKDALDEVDVLRVGFAEPAGFEVCIELPARVGQRARLLHNNTELPAVVEVAIERIVEVAIRFDDLGVGVDEGIEFAVEVITNGQSRDRAPRQGGIRIARPSVDFERIMWDV